MKIRLVVLAVVVSFLQVTWGFASDFIGVDSLVETHVGSSATFDDLAASASEVTGVSIHPFFVVSAMGAYKYFTATELQRVELEWYCNPVVWGTIAVLLLIIHLRRYVSVVAPLMTKPIEAAENLFNQTAPLVGGCAVLPTALRNGAGFISAMGESASTNLADGVLYASFASPTMVQIIGWSIFAIVLLGGFLCVWFVSNALDVLLLLCPIGGIEILTTYTKISLIALIALLAFISPILALAFCAVVVFIAWKIAGWAFRLTVFGWILSLDLLLGWAIHRNIDCTEPKAFGFSKKPKVPARTYGKIVKTAEGAIAFQYRPAFFLPPKTVVMPTSNLKLTVGAIMPSISAGEGKECFRCLLPPRYRGRETMIKTDLCISVIEDGAVLRGLKSCGRWIKESLGQQTDALPSGS